MRDTLRHGMFGLLSLSMPTMCYPCLRTPVTHVSGLNIKPGDDSFVCSNCLAMTAQAYRALTTFAIFITRSPPSSSA